MTNPLLVNKDLKVQPEKLVYKIFQKYDYQEENVTGDSFIDAADVRISIVGDDETVQRGIGLRARFQGKEDSI